jgi:acetyl esterase
MDPAFEPLAKHPRPVLRDAGVVRRQLLASRQARGASPSDKNMEIEECSVAAADAQQKQVVVRIHRPKSAPRPLPVLLYLHGGGFFCGDRFSEEPQCIYYALNVVCAVVCVEYRLAPEEPYPAALRDCYAVLEFLASPGNGMGLDPERIAVGGSSAGANLAAAVTLLARDRKGPGICFQMLLVPALDDRLETPSARQFTDLPDFARPEAEVMWRWYLGEDPENVSPYAAPARAEDLSGLPAAYVLCAGLDPLRDEGLRYAERMTAAGVAVELHLVPSIPHGFASVPSAATSQQLLREQAHVLRRAFRGKRDNS